MGEGGLALAGHVIMRLLRPALLLPAAAAAALAPALLLLRLLGGGGAPRSGSSVRRTQLFLVGRALAGVHQHVARLNRHPRMQPGQAQWF
jgi:hypothetical protein